MTEKNQKPSQPCHGWLVLDKPLGLTSTQALGRVRRLVGGRKAGHAGTLDPLASGVLPLAFGEATKTIPFVMDGEKSYEFTVRWGEQRSTDDAEGEVIATHAYRPSAAAIEALLPQFRGTISQKPPTFSAIKLEGKRAYDLARKGQEPVLAARPVIIHELRYLGAPSPDEAAFTLRCGKGTYVRSLARDMALALGSVGYVSALRRTRSGPFTVNDSISLEKLEEMSHKGTAQTALLAVQAALDDIPGLPLSAEEARALRQGQGLLIRPYQEHLIGAAAVLASFNGDPVALVKPEKGEFRVLRGFAYTNNER